MSDHSELCTLSRLSHSPPSHVANLTAPQLDQVFQTPARTSIPPPPTRSARKIRSTLIKMSDHSELCTLLRLSHSPPSHVANLTAPQLDQIFQTPARASFPPPPTRSARKIRSTLIKMSDHSELCTLSRLSHSPPSHVANLTAPQLDQIFQTPARASFPPPPTRSARKIRSTLIKCRIILSCARFRA